MYRPRLRSPSRLDVPSLTIADHVNYGVYFRHDGVPPASDLIGTVRDPSKFRLAHVPPGPGVYALTVGNQLQYIGECDNWRRDSDPRATADHDS